MGTEFKRLRRKNAVWRFLRALMTGLSVGFLLAGVMLLMFKLTSTDGRVMLCLLVGITVAAVVMTLRWLTLRRSDLRAAEQMDLEHGLRERVQTMIAFRDEESAMLTLQRMDTEEKLKTVRSYGIKTGAVVTVICALTLSVVVLAAGLILPARAEVVTPPATEPQYDATAWQIASLEELIAHVQESNMAEPARELTVAELHTLRQTLDGSITVSAFKEQVIAVIANIYTHTDGTNSNDDMHDVIRAIDHDQAGNIAYVMGCLGNLEFGADVEDIGYQLSQEENLPTIADLAQQMQSQLGRIPTEYLPENSYTEDDPLYLAAMSLAAGLQDVAALVEAEAEAEAISARLGEVVHVFKSAANLALEQQTVTKEECVYAVETLCGVFGISASECPKDPDPTYTKELDDEDIGDVGGGAGPGEMQYAGDEQIYDYKQNQHVSYTEVIAEYYASMIQASLEGELSEEMIEFILKYFSQLYTG